tara:strand:+ start:233 stop:1582 length:1350 start_codon:yes stop_codon:yes gene_type:complete
MNKRNNVIFLILLFLLSNCSFDSKTGYWDGLEEEKRRVKIIQAEQEKQKNLIKIYASEKFFYEEKALVKNIILSKPKKNSSWETTAFNNQNFLGNIYLKGVDNRFLKEKIGKNKFSLAKISSQPLSYKNDIFISDSKGSIYRINEFGKIIWKQNIYKKIYKKIYKNLAFTIYKNNIYISDNIGLIYAVNADTGKIVWVKNHGIPFKSKIKISDDRIFLINQDNRILSFSTKDGSLIWSVRSASSFIKAQDSLSLALSKKGDVIAITSSGDLYKINSKNGQVYWSFNTLEALGSNIGDFFKSSDIVVHDKSIIFSTKSSIFSYDLETGGTNWKNEVSSVATPIVDGKNVFFVTETGYFIIVDLISGDIISSNYIFKVLKKSKQATVVTGYIMGSGKLYTITLNGYLITSSASTGKVEGYKKIGKIISSSPIINNGKMFVYTKKSKILGFN